MPSALFPSAERAALLALKGVGPAVLGRLEQMGIASLAQLSAADVESIVSHAARLTGSTCWKNSPQARAAVQAAIDLARSASAEAAQSTGAPCLSDEAAA